MAGRGHRLQWLAAAIGVALVAVVIVLVVSGSGSSPSQPFTYSVKEARLPCSGGSFFPGKTAQHFLDQPPPKNWSVVQSHPGAVFANSELVELQIHAGSADAVTLDSVRFHIERRKRPDGVTLYPGCFEQLSGWLMVAEFDQSHPKAIIYNHEDPEEKVVPLPWKVSLEEPFEILIQPNTSHCYCVWTAEIPWSSGSDHGVIRIAEGEKPFEVTFTGGMPAHSAEDNGWS